MLIIEKMDRSLADDLRLRSKDQGYSAGRIRSFLHCCTTALIDLHSRDIVHGDIHIGSIMLVGECIAKLGDLGSTRATYGSSMRPDYLTCPSFLLPVEARLSHGYNTKTDVYLLSLVLPQLLLWRPLEELAQRDGFIHEARARCAEVEDKNLKEVFDYILETCLQDDHERRPTARELQARLEDAEGASGT